jgi:hypothetical protein
MLGLIQQFKDKTNLHKLHYQRMLESLEGASLPGMRRQMKILYYAISRARPIGLVDIVSLLPLLFIIAELII